MSLLMELRNSCASCVCKHLSQALVLMQEVPQGYPKHHWIAVGHLGEAADEAVKEFPKLAAEIRKHRIKYMADPNYTVPILDLIDKASKHVKNEAKMTPKGQEFVSDEISHLMKDGPSKGPQEGKKMPQKQAIAVALDVSRRNGFKTAPNPKEENMSIFDSIIEGEMPEAFKKYAGKWRTKGESPEHEAAESSEEEREEHERDEEGPDESISVFDAIVENSVDPSAALPVLSSAAPGASQFDEFVEDASSMFDDIIESKNSEVDGWNDRVARTMALAEELIDLSSSRKSA